MKLASQSLFGIGKAQRETVTLDGVAGFHVGNGAEFHRVNFAVDPSRKGVQNSFGMMVNYCYDPETVEAKGARDGLSNPSQPRQAEIVARGHGRYVVIENKKQAVTHQKQETSNE
jgi:hypothetical protein